MYNILKIFSVDDILKLVIEIPERNEKTGNLVKIGSKGIDKDILISFYVVRRQFQRYELERLIKPTVEKFYNNFQNLIRSIHFLLFKFLMLMRLV